MNQAKGEPGKGEANQGQTQTRPGVQVGNQVSQDSLSPNQWGKDFVIVSAPQSPSLSHLPSPALSSATPPDNDSTSGLSVLSAGALQPETTDFELLSSRVSQDSSSLPSSPVPSPLDIEELCFSRRSEQPSTIEHQGQTSPLQLQSSYSDQAGTSSSTLSKTTCVSDPDSDTDVTESKSSSSPTLSYLPASTTPAPTEFHALFSPPSTPDMSIPDPPLPLTSCSPPLPPLPFTSPPTSPVSQTLPESPLPLTESSQQRREDKSSRLGHWLQIWFGRSIPQLPSNSTRVISMTEGPRPICIITYHGAVFEMRGRGAEALGLIAISSFILGHHMRDSCDHVLSMSYQGMTKGLSLAKDKINDAAIMAKMIGKRILSGCAAAVDTAESLLRIGAGSACATYNWLIQPVAGAWVEGVAFIWDIFQEVTSRVSRMISAALYNASTATVTAIKKIYASLCSALSKVLETVVNASQSSIMAMKDGIHYTRQYINMLLGTLKLAVVSMRDILTHPKLYAGQVVGGVTTAAQGFKTQSVVWSHDIARHTSRVWGDAKQGMGNCYSKMKTEAINLGRDMVTTMKSDAMLVKSSIKCVADLIRHPKALFARSPPMSREEPKQAVHDNIHDVKELSVIEPPEALYDLLLSPIPNTTVAPTSKSEDENDIPPPLPSCHGKHDSHDQVKVERRNATPTAPFLPSLTSSLALSPPSLIHHPTCLDYPALTPAALRWRRTVNDFGFIRYTPSSTSSSTTTTTYSILSPLQPILPTPASPLAPERTPWVSTQTKTIISIGTAVAFAMAFGGITTPTVLF